MEEEKIDPALPRDLLIPDHDRIPSALIGRMIPALKLASTSGESIDLAQAAQGTLVLYIYPRTGAPHEPDPLGWEDVPDARGSGRENRGFRDRARDFRALGVLLLGLSAQPLEQQRTFAQRMGIDHPLLNDSDLRLADQLGLPTFELASRLFYERLTLVAEARRISKVFHPVFPPADHADQVLHWLWDRSPKAPDLGP